VSEVISPPVN